MEGKSLRHRARAGGTVRGAMVFEFFSPGIGRILELAGAEFALFDMEHTGLGLETLKSLCASCRGLKVAPMARVPRGEYHFIARALDVGAQGIMVPMVESAAHAQAIVEAVRYPPDGRRGAAFGFAHDHYAAGDVLATMRTANARNLVIGQIETERGLDAVEDIAAVEGVDVLWLGHFDLTNFLGVPGQFDHPKYLGAIDRIVAAARHHKKGLGFMAADAATARRYRALGFNMLASGTDQGLLMAGVKAILDGIESKA
jgi:2-dehydro-3-deoxyglucarate aldolase/4-hydroxy-2-oxoheptanedioate aldolase